MKNIHVLPTDKPSMLRYNLSNVLVLTKGYYNDYDKKDNQHIYITNSEEIKQGDWHLVWLKNKWEVLNYMPSIGYRKECLGKEVCKIILTTDQDLINDGVQAIEDDFLEWFVHNPSCDFVEVERGYLGMWGFCKSSEIISKDKIHYKIIIPKEEPKQETLEEAAERLVNRPYGNVVSKSSFIEGAKWQQERMYSEEDLVHLLNFVSKEYNISNGIGWFHTHESIEDIPSIEVLGKWFEQFKKKV